MKSLIFVLVVLMNISLQAQEEIINQCFVLQIDSDDKIDLREATFDLPFAAMRASEENKKKKVLHYIFDIEATDNNEIKKRSGLTVKALRPYEYGEVLGENEIAFFVMEWPEGMAPVGTGNILASFPSLNRQEIKTDHLVFNHPVDLPELLVQQLNLSNNKLGPGIFPIHTYEMEY